MSTASPQQVAAQSNEARRVKTSSLLKLLAQAITMDSSTKSGIRTNHDGSSYIPASKRADGSTRKEIRVRPGYQPPEDVETYKNRSAEAFKNRGKGGVPGVDVESKPSAVEAKSKNAKRREAAKRNATTANDHDDLTTAMKDAALDDKVKGWNNFAASASDGPRDVPAEDDAAAERQKKVRNALKKLKAVRELKEKKSQGEKLSPDQLLKISKEEEILRDLKKLDYDGTEVKG